MGMWVIQLQPVLLELPVICKIGFILFVDDSERWKEEETIPEK